MELDVGLNMPRIASMTVPVEGSGLGSGVSPFRLVAFLPAPYGIMGAARRRLAQQLLSMTISHIKL
jgi:hypothetical protein